MLRDVLASSRHSYKTLREALPHKHPLSRVPSQEAPCTEDVEAPRALPHLVLVLQSGRAKRPLHPGSLHLGPLYLKPLHHALYAQGGM